MSSLFRTLLFLSEHLRRISSKGLMSTFNVLSLNHLVAKHFIANQSTGKTSTLNRSCWCSPTFLETSIWVYPIPAIHNSIHKLTSNSGKLCKSIWDTSSFDKYHIFLCGRSHVRTAAFIKSLQGPLDQRMPMYSGYMQVRSHDPWYSASVAAKGWSADYTFPSQNPKDAAAFKAIRCKDCHSQ